jgi:hypothetical protein
LQNKTKITQNIYWQWVFRIIKWVVPFLIAVVLYKKFYRNASFSLSGFSEQLALLPWSFYAMMVIFSIINWSLETWKWKFLLRKLEPVSFKTALKSVMSGMAVSQLLPYRTGEYLGRLAYISDTHKLSAGVLSVAGSFSQLLVTMSFGIVAFVFIHPLQYPVYMPWILLVLTALLLSAYFLLPRSGLFSKIRLVEQLLSAFRLLSSQDLLRTLLLSCCRYAAFVLPYAFLARHYHLPASTAFSYTVMAVCCIYFLQTVSPNFILTDFVIRMSVPALVFSGSTQQVNGMEYVPGMLIYLFNIAIPMCVGAVILLLAKLRR